MAMVGFRHGRRMMDFILGLAIFASTLPAFGQADYAGNYSGSLYSEQSGLISLPNRAIGAVLLTIDSAGNIRNGLNNLTGGTVGIVTAAGAITFNPPLGAFITQGRILNNAITGTNSVSNSGLTTTFSVLAPRTGPAATAPRIIVQPPARITTNIASQVRLTVSAGGTDLAYQWFLGASGQTANPIPGATTNTYLTPRIYGTSNYWVRITNSIGSLNSTASSILVNGVGVRPGFFSQPVSITRDVGARATLTAGAVGTPDIFFQWLRENRAIPGATNDSLSFTNLTLADAGSYSVTISNVFGTATSSNAVLTVRAAGMPELTSFPSAQVNIAVGARLSLEAVALGNLPLFFQWYKDVFGRLTPLVNETNSFYVRTNVQRNEGGTYALVVSNSVASVTNRTLVSVIDIPTVASQPEEVRVSVGQQLTIGPRSFSGAAPTRFQWYKDGLVVTNATNQFYTKTAALSDQGQYYVEIGNIAGSSKSATVPVTVYDGPVPAWIKQNPPAAIAVEEGQFLSIFAQGEGTRPVRYFWQQDGAVVFSAQDNASFQSNAVKIASTGIYQLVASNIAGMSTSTVSRITVYPKQNAPQFVTTFITTNKTAGESLVLDPVLRQGDLLSFQWKKQFNTNNNFVDLPLPGETNKAISFASLKASDAGRYLLSATNFKGEAAMIIQLNVIAPPSITRHPESQEALAGSTVNLSVTIENFTSDTSSQWYFNGAPLAGSTQISLGFPMSDSRVGEYYLVAKNQAGSVTSQVARVQIAVATPATRELFLIADRTIPMPNREPETFRVQSDGMLNGRIVSFMGITNFPDVGGIYRYQPKQITKVADFKDMLPGFTTATTQFDAQTAEDAGVIHFTASATNSAQWGLFQWTTAGVTRVFGEGMTFPNKPTELVKGFGYPTRKKGRTAFFGLGVSAIGFGDGYRGAFVLEQDLKTLVKWADNEAPLPAGTGKWTGNSSQVGFDGTTLAFWVVDSASDNGIFATVNGSPLRKVAFTGDPIPGGGTFKSFSSPPTVANGRILFFGSGQLFGEQYLMEDDNGTLKVIARSGTGQAFSSLQYRFGYAGDGSVLFTASGPGSKHGIYRYRNGSITPEITSFNTLNGRPLRFVFLEDADGDECLIHLSFNGVDFGLYSTLRPDGTVTPARPSIGITRNPTGMTLTWEGGGTLESSGDLTEWNNSATSSPATIRFDSANQRFFRIKSASPSGGN